MELNPAREDGYKHAILRKMNADVTIIVWIMLRKPISLNGALQRTLLSTG
jgi:hypothetical protein